MHYSGINNMQYYSLFYLIHPSYILQLYTSKDSYESFTYIKNQMGWLQQLRDFFKPSSVSCNDLGLDSVAPFDPTMPEDEFQAHMPALKHKVPGFQHFINPVLMVTHNPDIIKGFKFDFSLPLSEYFSFSHSWSLPNSGTQQQPNQFNPMMMPTMAKPTYTFTSQLVKDIRGQQPYTVMMGKVDNQGKVDAIFIRKLHQNISMRITGSFQNSNVDQGVLTADVDIEGRNSMNVLRVGQGIFGFSTMQRIHPNLMLGFDYTNLFAQKLSFLSYGLKAFAKSHSIFAQYIALQDQYHLGYVVPIKKGTQFVAHYKYDARERKPSTILGFKQRYAQSDILATLNSSGEVSTALTLRNPSFSIKLCAVVDYIKQKYSFGYGVTLGQAM